MEGEEKYQEILRLLGGKVDGGIWIGGAMFKSQNVGVLSQIVEGFGSGNSGCLFLEVLYRSIGFGDWRAHGKSKIFAEFGNLMWIRLCEKLWNRSKISEH